MKPREYWSSSFADVIEFVYARSEYEQEQKKVTYDAMRISTAWIVNQLVTNMQVKPTDIVKFKDEADHEENELENILNNHKNIDFSAADKIAREMGFLK